MSETKVQAAVLRVRRALDEVRRKENDLQDAFRSGNPGRFREAQDRLAIARSNEIAAHKALSLATLESLGLTLEPSDEQLDALLVASGAEAS